MLFSNLKVIFVLMMILITTHYTIMVEEEYSSSSSSENKNPYKFFIFIANLLLPLSEVSVHIGILGVAFQELALNQML